MVGSLRETPEKKDRPQSHCCVPLGNPEDLFRESLLTSAANTHTRLSRDGILAVCGT